MKQFIDFINKSYTAFHAIKNLEEMLEKANFKKLTEDCSWELEPGCSYYVIRNTSSIIAFKVPKSTTNVGFNIVASHSDSPSFKVKPNGVVIDTTNDFCKLNTEGYGGMITYSWFDRPLGVAGRVYTQSENSVKEHLVNFDETLESWATQGILMLNSALTCEVNKPGSHSLLWRPFISSLLQNLSNY